MKTYTSHVSAKRPLPRVSQRQRSQQITRAAMVTDICLVAAWGAMIPGLMWLGVASGF